MTKAYHKARHIIKHHVNANTNDILITDGTGMTGVVNKLQHFRIKSSRKPQRLYKYSSEKDQLFLFRIWSIILIKLLG
jgi:hypothetical protein